jgi:hypothetical protein
LKKKVYVTSQRKASQTSSSYDGEQLSPGQRAPSPSADQEMSQNSPTVISLTEINVHIFQREILDKLKDALLVFLRD